MFSFTLLKQNTMKSIVQISIIILSIIALAVMVSKCEANLTTIILWFILVLKSLEHYIKD